MNTHNKALTTVNTQGTSDRKMQGQALRTVMETALSARQMSVSALARESSVQRGDIYKWWRGETRPSRNSLARIAVTLHVDTGILRSALGEPLRTTQTTADLVSALRDQTEAIGALVAKLDEGWEERLRAVEAELRERR
jgi:transcriptional regulator with XRE-family HTH domain